MLRLQKCTYLIRSLEGMTYNVLDGFNLTKEKCEQAIDTLKPRFGMFQQIIGMHMREILLLNTYPNTTITQLRRLLDKINVHLWDLKALALA